VARLRTERPVTIEDGRTAKLLNGLSIFFLGDPMNRFRAEGGKLKTQSSKVKGVESLRN